MNPGNFFRRLTKNLPKLVSILLAAVIAAGLLFYGLTALGTLKNSRYSPK